MNDTIQTFMTGAYILFLFTLPLSIINAFAAPDFKPCNTYGYYLPATYCLCKLNEVRK